MQIETYSKLNQVMLTFFNDCFVLYKQQPQHSTFAEYKNSLKPQVFIDEFLKYFNNESVLSSDSGHPVSTTIFTKLFEEYWVSRAWAQNIAVSKDLYNSDEGYLLKALNKIVSTQDCKNLNPILEKFIVCLNLDMDPIPFSKILHTGEQTPIISLMEKHLGKTFASLINLNIIDSKLHLSLLLINKNKIVDIIPQKYFLTIAQKIDFDLLALPTNSFQKDMEKKYSELRLFHCYTETLFDGYGESLMFNANNWLKTLPYEKFVENVYNKINLNSEFHSYAEDNYEGFKELVIADTCCVYNLYPHKNIYQDLVEYNEEIAINDENQTIKMNMNRKIVETSNNDQQYQDIYDIKNEKEFDGGRSI